jgi:hypothetical protein
MLADIGLLRVPVKDFIVPTDLKCRDLPEAEEAIAQHIADNESKEYDFLVQFNITVEGCNAGHARERAVEELEEMPVPDHYDISEGVEVDSEFRKRMEDALDGIEKEG